MIRYVFFTSVIFLSSCLFFGANNDTNNTPKTDVSPDFVDDIKVCPGDPSCGTGLTCGNEVLDAEEECDESADPMFQDSINAASCSTVDGKYQSGGQLGCMGCEYDFSSCNFCGNGALNETLEECDGQEFREDVSCLENDPNLAFGQPLCGDGCVADYSSCRQGFIDVSVGEKHICAVMSNGEIVCWGGNVAPNGPGSDDNADFVKVSVGGEVTCGLKSDRDKVFCWNHKTGIPDGENFTGVSQMSAGSDHHCFLRPNNEVYCNGLSFPNSPKASDLTGSSKIASGTGFVCGLQNGTPNCLFKTNDVKPAVAEGTNFTDIFAGPDYVCGLEENIALCPAGVAEVPAQEIRHFALGSDGKCWINISGRTECSSSIGAAPNLMLTNVSVGNKFACGIIAEGLSFGEIQCWGKEYPNSDPSVANDLL